MAVITFLNTRSVIVAERAFREEKIEFKVIPTPREISSECGMSIQLKSEFVEPALDYLKKNEMSFDKVYSELL